MPAHRLFAALGIAASLALACAGFGDTVVDDAGAVEPTFRTSAAHLIQDRVGLWTPSGERVSDVGGSSFPDAYVIDTARAASFVLSDAGGVHVLRRQGTDFTVEKVREDGFVERPIGDVALVRLPGGDRVIVGLDGQVLREGVRIDVVGDQEPPVDQPEYWWTLDYFARPAPVCSADGCGWIGTSGDWIRPPGKNAVPPLYLPAVATVGGPIVSVDGSVTEPDTPHAGPPSEGLYVAGRPRPEAPSRMITEVRTLDGSVQGTVAGQVVWKGDACAGPRGDGGCQYLFHQQRAAIRLLGPGGRSLQTAYLAPDATVVIGPDDCAGSAPSGPFHDDRAFHCVGSEYWLIDRAGERIAGPWKDWGADAEDRNSYPYGLYFSEGLAAVPVEGGWAYVDTAGEVVLPGPYRLARPFRLGIAAVMQGDDVVYIDRTGKPFFGG